MAAQQCPVGQPPQSAPSGFTATPGKAKITFNWSAVACATYYEVYRLSGPNGSIVASGSSTGTSFVWNAPGIYNGNTYYFYVNAKNSYGGGPVSQTVSATLSLDAPSLTATSGKAKITVSWGSVPDADSYKVCWANANSPSNINCQMNITGTSVEYTGYPFFNGQTYNFFAYSTNAGGDGTQSATTSASLSLNAPAGLSPRRDPGSGQVTVTWGAVANADSYVVVRSLSTSIPSPYPGWDNLGTYTTTSMVDAYPYSGVRYYQVVAQNSAGQGLKSLVVSTDGQVFACSPHAACSVPWYRSSGGESGSSYPDPVNLATGDETYAHEADLAVYNPNGPQVSWQRQYQSYQARSGYASPGLSLGWTHSYDQFLRGPSTAGTWGALTLNYSNGAAETLTPVLDGAGQPTGAFTSPTGLPYFVQGTPGASAGSWQSVTVTWKDQTQWRFTPLSSNTYALSQLTNRTGQGVTLTWSAARALTQVSDISSGAMLLSLSYGGDGRLASVTDAYDRQISYGYSAPSSPAPGLLGTVSQVASVGTQNPPARWTYAYSALGQLLSSVTAPSPAGSGTSTTTINYDSLGRVTSLVDANGNQSVFIYGANSTQVQVKNPAGAVVQSRTQNFSGQRDTGVTDANNHSTAIAYGDANNPNRPTSVTDRNGKVTTYTYDQFGNVLTVTNPRNVTTAYTWSYTAFPLGRLTGVQEGTKPATTLTYYEPSGLVQSVTSPSPTGSGTVTNSFTYDSLGNVLTATGPGNNAASQITTALNYTTDGTYTQAAKVGQPITMTDNLGHVTHLRYDAQGRVTSVTDALGYETNRSYNLAGQPAEVLLPATGQTGTGRSRSVNAYLYVGGPLVTTTVYDENNVQTRQVSRSYGLEGELLSVTGSTEPVTYTYDALYRLKTLKDGNNNTTTYNYNSVGRVSSVQMPGGETVQFPSYDDAGHLLQRIDGNNVTTNYLYNDAENLLTDIQYPATPALNVHFGYDNYGRRTSMTDGAGSHGYSYNDADALTGTTTTYTGLPAKAVSYLYYPNGSRQNMITPAGTFSYSYDVAGRASSLTNPFGETSAWAYFDNNRLLTQTLANGAQTSYGYNAAGQMTGLLNEQDGFSLSDYGQIAYNGAGNRRSLMSGLTNYLYDTKQQLTQEQRLNGGTTDTFAYDGAGNPVSFKGVTKTYNSNNQQTGAGFTHDANGNPTTYKGTTLSFDAENRLTAHGASLTAGYRGDGLRAWKETAGGRTYFLYDGTTPIIELEASGAHTATNTFGAHGLVSRYRNNYGSRIFYTFDAQGSVAQRLDLYGNVLTSRSYTAHGQMVGKGVADPFGYKARWGYYTDTETGLLLLTHRYYDPQSGRFLTRDPISYNGGINLYGYVANNPLNFIDPLGLDILVIENGSTGLTSNPIGHTAIAITGHGVYSFGNGTPRGSSLQEYLLREAARRNTTVWVIKTTPEQDAAAMQAIWDYGDRPLGGVASDNCSTRTNHGLDAAGIDYSWLCTTSIRPGSAGCRAKKAGGTRYDIPQGSKTVPIELQQFEPR